MCENGSNGMETREGICEYTQTGLCKFRYHYRRKHEIETCVDQINCNKQICTKGIQTFAKTLIST